ncbi:MAG: nucleotidyltransferase family protein [Candidatus Cryosericum sp.]
MGKEHKGTRKTPGAKTLVEIKRVLRNSKQILADKYGVSSIAVFGSYARGQQKANSDVDLLVDFDRAIGGFAFIELANDLEELLGMNVDLLTPRMIKHNPYLEKKILEELQVV